ncbi:unnamed protein product [Triticum turgidum subsp. durum]|uniref:Uncharacterized protein n=1 Tax=Triticum turgidum subsp. durum TaxID=4567 RepID=A0A9R0WPD8_TRITD|nr:unnamed protein product [Triticum turgidum subsp. durum]
MCVQRGGNPPGILDGLYGVQIVRRPPQALSKGEAAQTSFTDSPTCEHQNGGGTVTQQHQRLLIRRLWQQRPSCLKPIHCSITCMAASVPPAQQPVTSMPVKLLQMLSPLCPSSSLDCRHRGKTSSETRSFFALFVSEFVCNKKSRCRRKNLNAAIYANSLVGVGIASGLYHSSRGEIRKILRWADYTMIATTTLCLSRAVRNENPGLLMAASTLLLPFQPFMVSAVHTGMMEASNPNDLADSSV